MVDQGTPIEGSTKEKLGDMAGKMASCSNYFELKVHLTPKLFFAKTNPLIV